MGNDTKGPRLRFPNFPPKDDGQQSHALWLDVSDCALYLMKTKGRFFWIPTRPYFNQYWCFWQIFFLFFFQLDLLLSGYVNDSSQDAVQLVRELFHEIPSLPKSQNLRIREWRIVLSLLRKTLKVWFFITDGYVEFIPETRVSQDFVVFVPNPFNYVFVYLYFIHLKKYWLYSLLCIDINFERTPTSNLKSMYIFVEIQIFSANMIHR